MEEQPEYALELLENIDKSNLTTKKVQAKYALLYTIALDKNYIDITSDSIIAPAVDYYRNNGSAYEKFASLYYNGRVYQNAGKIESAMKRFVEAEHLISNQVDKAQIARLYKAKTVAYQDIYDYESAVNQAQIAARYFLEACDTTRYINTIRDIAILYSQLDEYESQLDYLEILEDHHHLMNEYQLNGYYAIKLDSSFERSISDIEQSLSTYLASISNESIIHWLHISNAYIRLKDYESAQSALEKYLSYGGLEAPPYYWTAATLYECRGEYDKALYYHKEYQRITDNIDLSIFESDTKFIEERYNAKLKSLKKSLYIVITTLSLVLITLILIILAHWFRKIKEAKRRQQLQFAEERRVIVEEKEQAEEQCALLKEENDEVERMYLSLKAELAQLKKIKKDKSINKDIIESVEQRLNILNMFILAELSDSFRKIAYTELGKLMENREEFLESTKKTFMISHPKFMKFLRNSNLTEWEIGCCCLYCIGFNGAEISEYLKRKAIYNVNGVIRHKLNIPKGKTQIDVFLRHKMHEFSI